MIEITVNEMQWQVTEVPGGQVRVLRVLDEKSGIIINIPVDRLAAQQVARALAGGNPLGNGGGQQ